MQTVKRGYYPQDNRDFNGKALETLKSSARDLLYLLNRGYPIKPASTFIGNHYLLSERQRTALTRVVCPEADAAARKTKQKRAEALAGATVNIDGFNTIITLEVAQSVSPVFLCMDGTYRDLAGLRGTYRLIDKTDIAIRYVFSELQKLAVKRAVFWLDAPVSNSGRQKARIAEIAEEMKFDAGIEVVNNVDAALYSLENVISSDSIVIGHCPGWLNLCGRIIPGIPGIWIVDLMK